MAEEIALCAPLAVKAIKTIVKTGRNLPVEYSEKLAAPINKAINATVVTGWKGRRPSPKSASQSGRCGEVNLALQSSPQMRGPHSPSAGLAAAEPRSINCVITPLTSAAEYGPSRWRGRPISDS